MKVVVEAAPVEVVVTQRETPAACVTGKIDPSSNAVLKHAMHFEFENMFLTMSHVSSESSLPSPVDVVVTQRETPAACVTGKIDPSS